MQVTSSDKLLTGKEAAVALWTAYKEKLSGKAASTTSVDISEIKRWSFLFDDASKTEVAAAYKEFMSASKASGHVVEEVKAKGQRG